MNIEYLIQLVENKLNVLMLIKDQAFLAGDLERINAADEEIFGIQDTLTKLRLLLSVSQETAVTNSTLLEAMKMRANVITDGSTECLNDYDIESYAADPLHEEKIIDILSAMGPMVSMEAIDVYIDSEAIGSPITGQMILSAAQQYFVDARLMMAIMELDSRFGTVGVAIDTLNPGNVGNTGTAVQSYGSWENGVSAVAEWLSHHRKATSVPINIQQSTSTTTDTTTTPDISEAPVANLGTSTTTASTSTPISSEVPATDSTTTSTNNTASSTTESSE